MNIEQLGNIKLINCDCMEYLETIPDNYYSLALVDPPYGIGFSNKHTGGGWIVREGKNWDNEIPDAKYFEELFRVSQNQIIWGGNYFPLPLVRGWIFWDKGINGDCSFADGELAWTSFDRVLRKASIIYKGFLGADKERIHNTQKPVALYKWLLKNYAKQGDKILDTHFGSLSIGIACHDMGFDLTACELDKDYYEAGKQRLINHQKQLNLF